MSNHQYIVTEPISGDVSVGTEGDGTRVMFGKVAETGSRRSVWFGGSKEFVGLVIGKRGSGKSHSLGVLLEGLCTAAPRTSISQHTERRAVLLLDPMGNFWTTMHKVRADGPPKVAAQFAELRPWDLQPEDINVAVWLPAGFRNENDPPNVTDFTVRMSDLHAADLADLLGLNLLRDPQGAALDEAYAAVVEDGWTDGMTRRAANPNYRLPDLVDYLNHLAGQQQTVHSPSTLRALTRSLGALARQPVFSGQGTPLTDLLQPGRLGILMLPARVGHDLRRVVTRLLIRRILSDREHASQINQRLLVETLAPAEKTRLEAELARRAPRSVVAIDEAQELLGDDGGEAREALEDFCLLGRNYGLSLLLATQRPTTAAISAKVRSQADFYVIHRLLTQDDIDLVRGNLLAVLPSEVREGQRVLGFPELVRSLGKGQAIISASHAQARDAVGRIFMVSVRPRVTVHGGESV